MCHSCSFATCSALRPWWRCLRVSRGEAMQEVCTEQGCCLFSTPWLHDHQSCMFMVSLAPLHCTRRQKDLHQGGSGRIPAGRLPLALVLLRLDHGQPAGPGGSLAIAGGSWQCSRELTARTWATHKGRGEHGTGAVQPQSILCECRWSRGGSNGCRRPRLDAVMHHSMAEATPHAHHAGDGYP